MALGTLLSAGVNSISNNALEGVANAQSKAHAIGNTLKKMETLQHQYEVNQIKMTLQQGEASNSIGQ